MSNHYDTDINCKKCGKYISTIYPDEEVGATHERICANCRTQLKLRGKPYGNPARTSK